MWRWTRRLKRGGAKVWDGVEIADDNLLALHFNGDGSLARNANLAVVDKHDVLVVDVVVHNEGLVVRPKIVGGPTVLAGRDRRVFCLR